MRHEYLFSRHLKLPREGEVLDYCQHEQVGPQTITVKIVKEI